MPCEITAFLFGVIDAADSAASILGGISVEAYVGLSEKRSALECEFIVIGQAASMLVRFSPEKFRCLSDGRKAIGFSNMLTHNHASVDLWTVCETALQDVPKLRRECVEISARRRTC
jgi:uncharacterized protein with HEPN domain